MLRFPLFHTHYSASSLPLHSQIVNILNAWVKVFRRYAISAAKLLKRSTSFINNGASGGGVYRRNRRSGVGLGERGRSKEWDGERLWFALCLYTFIFLKYYICNGRGLTDFLHKAFRCSDRNAGNLLKKKNWEVVKCQKRSWSHRRKVIIFFAYITESKGWNYLNLFWLVGDVITFMLQYTFDVC